MARYGQTAIAMIVGVGAAATLGAAPPARAQEDYERIVVTMRACAAIEDSAARVMCYDNNIRPLPQGSVAASPAPSPAAPAGESARPGGFGSEMVARSREAARESRQDRVRAEIGAVEELAPGILLLTLADGAQWRFVDAAPLSYAPPRAGDTVEFERGSLGSAFLAYAGQRRMRVRRIR